MSYLYSSQIALVLYRVWDHPDLFLQCRYGVGSTKCLAKVLLHNIHYFNMPSWLKATVLLFSWHSLKLQGKIPGKKVNTLDGTFIILVGFLEWDSYGSRDSVKSAIFQTIPFYESSWKALQLSAVHIKSQKCITYQIVLNELLAKFKRWWGTVCQILELCLELHAFQNFNIKPKKHRSPSGASNELQSWQQDISIGVGWLEDFAFPLLSNYFNNWVIDINIRPKGYWENGKTTVHICGEMGKCQGNWNRWHS